MLRKAASLWEWKELYAGDLKLLTPQERSDGESVAPFSKAAFFIQIASIHSLLCSWYFCVWKLVGDQICAKAFSSCSSHQLRIGQRTPRFTMGYTPRRIDGIPQLKMVHRNVARTTIWLGSKQNNREKNNLV
jgi:hypothetical protein